jgi:hypothetical protein
LSVSTQIILSVAAVEKDVPPIISASVIDDALGFNTKQHERLRRPNRLVVNLYDECVRGCRSSGRARSGPARPIEAMAWRKK